MLKGAGRRLALLGAMAVLAACHPVESRHGFSWSGRGQQRVWEDKPDEPESLLKTMVPGPSDTGLVSIDAHHGGSDHDSARIDLPGLHINAHGDKADIRVLGADIHTDGDHADVSTAVGAGDAAIHAGPAGAEIRAVKVGRHADQLVFILAGDASGPGGYKAVGYIARGPTNGPLVVGTFKSKGDGDHNRDLQRLIDLNVSPG
jgi:hypothetical protein